VLVPPKATGFGVQLTVPPFAGLAAVVIAKVIGVKVAVTLFAANTLARVHVTPVQSPLKAPKAKPAAGVAVQTLAPPWLTGFGVQLTVPPFAGLAVVAIGKVIGVKMAVTLFAASTLASEHVAPVQSPLKTLKMKPAAGVAVQVLVPPEGTGFGAQLTVPPFAGLAVVVIAKVGIGAKVADTVLAATTFVSVQVAPVQSPLKALKLKPAAGIAVQTLVPPEGTGLGVQVTVPPSAGLAAVVIARLGSGSIVSVSVALLLPGVGSRVPIAAATVATLLTLVPLAAVTFAATVIW